MLAAKLDGALGRQLWEPMLLDLVNEATNRARERLVLVLRQLSGDEHWNDAGQDLRADLLWPEDFTYLFVSLKNFHADAWIILLCPEFFERLADIGLEGLCVDRLHHCLDSLQDLNLQVQRLRCLENLEDTRNNLRLD